LSCSTAAPSSPINWRGFFSSHMAAASSISQTPFTLFQGSNCLKRRNLKNTSLPHSFSPSRSLLCSGFLSRRPLSRRNSFWVSKTMDGSVRTSAFRDGEGDENIQVFEQEAFIDGPSPLQSKFLSSEVEYKLNRLVRNPPLMFFNNVLATKVLNIHSYDSHPKWRECLLF